jgi:uncharacterized membrane protein YphA (DoxX/SURF4 family)
MRQRLSTAQPWLSTLARLFLAGVFFFSGWPKLLDSEDTIRNVRAYQLLPEMFVRPYGYALPLVELLIAVLLVIGMATRISSSVFAVMLLTYIFGISMAWARGLQINCGCFDPNPDSVGGTAGYYLQHIGLDTGFLLVAVLLTIWPRSRFSVDGVLGLNDPLEPATDQEPSGHAEGPRKTTKRAGRTSGDAQSPAARPAGPHR